MRAVKDKVFSVTFSALICALCVTLMLLARVISVADYSMTLICGLLMAVIVVECGVKWALASYVVVSALGLLLGASECALLFACFFGYYSVLKPYLERLPAVPEWLLKLLLFNGVIVALYAVIDWLVAPVLDIGSLSPTVAAILLLLMANAVFILYDFLFNRLITMYFRRVHPRIRRLR